MQQRLALIGGDVDIIGSGRGAAERAGPSGGGDADTVGGLLTGASILPPNRGPAQVRRQLAVVVGRSGAEQRRRISVVVVRHDVITGGQSGAERSGEDQP